jgi:hypothetical protein
MKPDPHAIRIGGLLDGSWQVEVRGYEDKPIAMFFPEFDARTNALLFAEALYHALMLETPPEPLREKEGE